MNIYIYNYLIMECLNCNNKFVTKKCSNCKIAWFCSKECQINGWKDHKKYCIKDEYLLWSCTEKISFFNNINNLQLSYKTKISTAIENYNLANSYFNKLILMQNSYHNFNDVYDQIINVSIISFKDNETEWRLLQNHSKEMYECYAIKSDDWSLTLIAFYDQLYEETINFRILISLSIAHCYFSLRLFYITKKKNTNIDKFFNECKNYYEIALLYKSKIKTIDYINNINNFMVKLEKIKRFIQKTF